MAGHYRPTSLLTELNFDGWRGDMDMQQIIEADRNDTLEAWQDLQDLQSLMELESLGEYTMFHSRGDRWVHPRKDSYRLHTEQLIHENRFHTEMRMSPDAVSKLIDILAPRIQRVEYNSRSEGPILPEHIVGVGLRTLAGGSLSDIRHIFKMSIAAAYGCFDDFIDGVNTAPELAIRAPQTAREWYQKNLGFLAKSSHRIMNGTALCIDGYFQRTNMPSLTEVTNQIAYYSGHYESYGVNCLAGVFSDLQFGHFCVISSGCTNDNQSYPRDTELVALIDSMPQELYVSVGI